MVIAIAVMFGAACRVSGVFDALTMIDGGADAVMTDLYMTGMGGWDLVAELHARRPDLPTIMPSAPT